MALVYGFGWWFDNRTCELFTATVLLDATGTVETIYRSRYIPVRQDGHTGFLSITRIWFLMVLDEDR
jgi:hypothetical protein